jgi:hypothetical protein
MKIIDCIINKFKNKKMTRGRVGKRVKLVNEPVVNKPHSSNTNIGRGGTFIIRAPYGTDRWYIETIDGVDSGWVYDCEIAGGITKEEIQKEIEILENQIKIEHQKLDWMSESGAEEYDENQFKVYRTLKLLENDKMSLMEKSKLIAELISGH